MSSRTIAPAAIAALAVIIFLGWRSYHVQEAELPPRVECTSQADAIQQGTRYVAEHGGAMLPIVGTGSMAPYIPAAPAGVDPMTVVVAWAITVPRATFANVTEGSLDLYHPSWSKGNVLHQAAAKSGDEWIMSGLHNAHYERGAWRMNEQSFRGIVAITYTWPE